MRRWPNNKRALGRRLLFTGLWQAHDIPSITSVQRRPNVFDVGPTLYKCYRNVLCLLEHSAESNQRLTRLAIGFKLAGRMCTWTPTPDVICNLTMVSIKHIVSARGGSADDGLRRSGRGGSPPTQCLVNPLSCYYVRGGVDMGLSTSRHGASGYNAPVTLSRIHWRSSTNAGDMCNTDVSANHGE